MFEILSLSLSRLYFDQMMTLPQEKVIPIIFDNKLRSKKAISVVSWELF